ncbi:AI-2E family transporter [Methanoculleus sp. 10]|uniref:AI-2E family transporter n=1 Tax=Methanoculleus sp. 10 TaxID=430615 RepID=UPI0025EEB457|nr:AI-2E family transporter [Methanoculleus sp. 10]
MLASLARVLVIGAILVTGMHLAARLVNPVLVAIVISVIAAPAVHRLERQGLRQWMAVLAVVGIAAGVSLLLIAVLGVSLLQIDRALPAYQDLLAGQLAILGGTGQDLAGQLPGSPGNPSLLPSIGTIVAGTVELTVDFLVTITVTVFMLLEIAGLRQKLRTVPGVGGTGLEEQGALFCRSLNRYAGIRTRGSLVTGVLVALLLWLMGIDAPVLWAILLVLFSYIPYLGLPIASVPPIGLAWLRYGLAGAVAVAAGIAVIDFLSRTLLTPHPARRELDLSPVVIILSVFFWPLVLGVPGLFLAVPLTLLAKAALASVDETRWLAALMEPADGSA